MEHDLGGVVPVVRIARWIGGSSFGGEKSQKPIGTATHIRMVAFPSCVETHEETDAGHDRGWDASMFGAWRVGLPVVTIQIGSIPHLGILQPSFDSLIGFFGYGETCQVCALERHHHPTGHARIGAHFWEVSPSSSLGVLAIDEKVDGGLRTRADRFVLGHPVGLAQREACHGVAIEPSVCVGDFVLAAVQVPIGLLSGEERVDGSFANPFVFELSMCVTGALKGEEGECGGGRGASHSNGLVKVL